MTPVLKNLSYVPIQNMYNIIKIRLKSPKCMFNMPGDINTPFDKHNCFHWRRYQKIKPRNSFYWQTLSEKYIKERFFGSPKLGEAGYTLLAKDCQQRWSSATRIAMHYHELHSKLLAVVKFDTASLLYYVTLYNLYMKEPL